MNEKKLDEWLSKNVEKPKFEKQKKEIRNKKPFLVNKKTSSQKLKIAFLGGLDEVGKNMTIFETEKDIVIVDMGLQFPEEEMYGVDFVIPDIKYLEDKKDKIRALILTHGHLDHIGAIPHICKKINLPMILGTPLTLGLAKRHVEDRGLQSKLNFKNISSKDEIRLGDFKIRFFHVNHSIPDCVGLVIETENEKIIHTGDFKFDLSPHDEKPADFSRIVHLSSGKKRKILLSDSTNSLKLGHTISEKKIGETLAEFIEKTPGRIIIASFSSLIGRMQKIVEAAQKYNRTVFISGYSMEKNVEVARKLGVIRAPKSQLLPLTKKVESMPPEKVLIITTGSQGEDLSALTRMALGNHSTIKINSKDSIVLSSSPIIGNERAISSVINNLCRLGAKVFTNQHMDVHTSGHGSREDLKLMISLVKPDYFIPIHGEFFMRKAHAEIAESLGVNPKNIFLAENGSLVDIFSEKLKMQKDAVSHNDIMVDGKGVGDVGTVILRERKTMAESGTIILLFKVDGKTKKLVGKPEALSRGFIFMTDSNEIISEVKNEAKKVFERIEKTTNKTSDRKIKIQREIVRFVKKKIGRDPLIVPIMIKV